MENLFAILFLVSLVLLVIGLFRPQTSLFWYKKERTRKKSTLIYGIVLLVCFVVFGIVSKNTKGTEQSMQSSMTGENSKQSGSTKLSYKKIGDQIEVGNFSYLIKSAKFAKSIGNEFSQETADGVFLIISVVFRNNDSEEHTIDDSLFKLTDEAGTEFSNSTEGESALVMSGKEILFLKSCNPHITKSGLLVFEVPEKKVYDLHLSGGFWNGETAIVKLTEQ